MSACTRDDLVKLPKKHDTFVGIDSDGCVFDTMEVKQKKFFHGEIVRFWKLEKIESQTRRAAEFVNLHSKTRGQNRFLALLRTFELMAEWPEVARSGVSLPDLSALRGYCTSGLELSHATLRGEAGRTGDAELRRILEWSLAVNRAIDRDMGEVPPFRGVRECLERFTAHSDVIVVSQTPEEALVKEWNLHGLARYAGAIAGQELGTKGQHLDLATRGKYDPDRILMIGDAPGDRKAAAQARAHFFPINPGREEASWARLLAEAYDRFLNGTYGGTYEQALAAEFEALLPERPPWARS